MSGRYAFVTLVTSDHYLPGALAVAAALKEVHPSPSVDPEVPFQTVCVVTPETVDVNTVKQLRRAFDVVIGVEVIEAQTAAELQLLGRLDLHTVLTKLHVFRLMQFEKIIFLDADILPIRPLSHLFTLPHEFSAVPDVGWPDIFNSGVMVLTPGEDKFNEIMSLVKSKGSWDGGDQGVLNEWRGNDWNRLSFTYNTTPTAAYTYAPAYVRFGPQISALHFIGPNKPWNEIPYRAPSSSSQAAHTPQQTLAPASSLSGTLAAASSQTYAYSSLVDRWFDVYDRNYRQQIPLSEQEYEVKRYENVWNVPTPSYHAPQALPEATLGGGLGLKELRKLAVEGGSSMSGRAHEGEYRRLPLEGRIDLMRPKRETTSEVNAESEIPASDQLAEEKASAPTGMQPLWHGQSSPSAQRLPTPGPDEVPPSPRIAPTSLPLSGPSAPRPALPTQQVGGQDIIPRQSQRPLPGPSAPPSHAGADAPSSFAGPGYSSSSQTGPSAQLSKTGPNVTPPSSSQGQEQQQHWQPPPPVLPPAEPPRPPSPPLLSWNPAIEPPPNFPPAPSAFPSDAYFPNVWDVPPSSGEIHAALTGSPPLVASAFFEPPPLGQIPQHLIKEGHYWNVMGSPEMSTEQSQSPDISKVSPVFPWEEKPRHMPARVFPEGESALPGAKYIEDMPPEPEPLVPETKLEAREKSPRMQNQMPSPPIGFPGARGYGNAWDSVASIQKYAARLAKPFVPSAAPPIIASRRRSDSYRSRGEQSDANSMDGDVEDEVDDDDNDANAGGRFSSSERSDNGKQKRGSKSGSKSPPSASLRSRSGKKDYRSYGVQTVPKDVRSVAVQVSQPTSISAGKSGGKQSTKQGSTSSSPTTMPPIDLPQQPLTQEMGLGMEQTAVATPGVASVQSSIRPSGSRQHQQGLPTGMLSPRLHDVYTFESPNRTPPNATPGTQSPTTRKPGQLDKLSALTIQQMQPLPQGVARASSTETADSPLGPVSPTDSPPVPPPRKPIGRSWNPATGVDVFKRGSEEVLARFLRMGSWEDESHVPTHGHG